MGVLFVAGGFAIGVLLFQQLSALPSVLWLLLSLPSILLLLFWPRWGWLFAIGLGFGWMQLTMIWNQPDASLDQYVGQSFWVQGYIADIPNAFPGTQRFEFNIESIDGNSIASEIPVSLSWYRSDLRVKAGETWHLQIKIKPVHGYHNPGGRDYEAFYYRQKIIYKGYVKKGQKLSLEKRININSIRQQVLGLLDVRLPDAPGKAVFKALLAGDRSGLTKVDWQLFSDTGTSHLMAISGLHIGLVAGLIYWLAYFSWCWFPRLCGRWPAAVAAVYPSVLAAVLYAGLAGFAIPTQRALIMLCIISATIILRKRLHLAHSLSLTVLLVLLWDPWAVSSPGFWFSFAAVALILYFVHSRQGSGLVFRWKSMLLLQLVLSFGLVPLLWFWGYPASLVSPLVNLLAIPWFGFVCVPLVLLSVFVLIISPTLAMPLLQLTVWLLETGLSGLRWAQSLAPLMPDFPLPSLTILAFSVLALAILLAPRAMPLKPLGLVLLLPLIFPAQTSRLRVGEFEFVLLDVGQGLSAFVRTAQHSLLFDTGPGFASGFNTGDAVVLPFLKHQQVSKLDMLIISHSDTDHAGGAAAILNKLEVDKLLVGEKGDWRMPQQTCYRGMRWRWDGVLFEVIGPGKGHSWNGNNASCVLRISNASASVLITGDMEKAAEMALLKVAPSSLESDIVVAGHHGSNSSSMPDFVRATQARYVLFANGYLNRWSFPKQKVVQRWADTGAVLLETAQSGAIRFPLNVRGALPRPEEYARKSKRYWHRILHLKYD